MQGIKFQKFRSLVVLGVVALVIAIMAITAPGLAKDLRFGLEFRGGYEIYYAVSAKSGSEPVTPEVLLATADVLRQRCDGIGMSEPEIHLEGENHIRLKIAGLTNAQQMRSTLSQQEGLPAIIEERYSQTVGSVLGQSALHDTLLAGAIGIGCMVVLLVLLYRMLGLVTAVSLGAYLWLLVAAFNTMHATLSLSAVVAFVLGVGMAADASIICLERVREEARRGVAAMDAIRTGFRTSFATIMDANAVTGLAMIALFVAGIGPIQGFSLTMLVSLIISFLTCFILVRTTGIALAGCGVPLWVLLGGSTTARASIATGSFVRWGRYLAVVSVAVVALGGWAYTQHGLNLDIDFTAGTALDIDLPQAGEQMTVTQMMTDAGTVPATVSIGGADNRHIAARFDQVLTPDALQQIIAAFQNQYGPEVVYEENTADPGIARAFAIHALYALLAACACIVCYISVRFSWSIGLAILLAIVHDLLMVTALFAIFRYEVDVTYIAALLTIMGYSLNDKIVIFSRIGQNQRDGIIAQGNDAPRRYVERITDLSIRQTLGRSINTVLTVVLASAALYQFGCEPLQMFALALLLGLLLGGYSSIYLACPAWIALRTRGNGTWRPTQNGLILAALVAAVVVGACSGTWWNAVRLAAIRNDAVAQGAAASSGLGDLAPFQEIAQSTLDLVVGGDLKGATARIKDLETAWDLAEEQLNPRDPAAWMVVDKAIDRALRDLRSGIPDPTTCTIDLKTLIAQCRLSAVTTTPENQTHPEHFVPTIPSATPLGNVSVFTSIADDTLRLLRSHDVAAATARITDLETVWDEAEDRLQEMNPDAWDKVDQDIDRALAQLRAKTPVENTCVVALEHLLSRLQAMQGSK